MRTEKFVESVSKHRRKMRNVLLTSLFLYCCLLANGQDYLKLAGDCFDKGDYECAKKNYTLFQTIDGRNMSAQIKNAEECFRILIIADEYFSEKDYGKAGDRYRALLDKNPSDPNAQKQYYVCVGYTMNNEKQEWLSKIRDIDAKSSERFSPVYYFKKESVIPESQLFKVIRVVEFLKNNPNSLVEITSISSTKTGSPGESSIVSETRARNIVRMLINQYGISGNRLSFSWKAGVSVDEDLSESVRFDIQSR